MNTPKKTRPESNTNDPVIRNGELYTLEEFAKRARWRRHSIRQARKLGLRTILFGSRRYVLGSDGLRFFERLAEQQAEKSVEQNP